MNPDSALQRVAQRYRSAGYDVIVRPQGEAVPSFARDLEPDIIATRGDQHIVVEVKSDLSDLAEDRSLPSKAEIVNAQPGWRFDVVILEQLPSVEQLALASAAPSRKQIKGLINHAERSALAGDSLSAFLVAWAGLEAAMRHLSRLADIAPARPTGATVLIRSLFSSGFLSSEELERLDEANQMRNQIVHGLSAPRIRRVDVDYVIVLARRLLEEDHKPGEVKK
jgi:hypothetical protein